MRKQINQNQNLNFWEEQADQHKGHGVSWWDVNMKRIEVGHIAAHLSKKDNVLDIGCSNGASTLDIQKIVGCKIHGFDYSPKAIKQAQKIKNPNLSFEVGDIMNYQAKNKYDKVFTIRCLINIMSKQEQYESLIKIKNILKPGGIFIMAEAFFCGLQNLNRVRRAFNLKPLLEPIYNKYFREKEFENFIKPHFSIIKIEKYASLYYVGTRLFQYLALDNDPKETNTELHRFFSKYGFETKNSGDFSPQKIYVLKKK